MPKAQVTVLCVQRLGVAGKKNIEILQSLPGVSEVINADYHYRVGDANENKRYLAALPEIQTDYYKKHGVQPNHFIDKSCNELVDDYLTNVHAIYIPGYILDATMRDYFNNNPHAVHDERRVQFESKLIQRARNKGIPVLAICGGAWSLAGVNGGEIKALDQAGQDQHDQSDNLREMTDMTRIIKGTMLFGIHQAAQANKSIDVQGDTAKKQLLNTPGKYQYFDDTYFKVNTTHRKTIVPPSDNTVTDFDKFFETSAVDVTTNTLEAFESKFGVPVVGVQFHPEYSIPFFKKKDGVSVIVEDYKTHRYILESWIEAAQAYKNKGEMLRELCML